MTLFDTNVLIYAFDPSSIFYEWARMTIAQAVGGEGGAINTIALAEICVGEEHPESVAERIQA